MANFAVILPAAGRSTRFGGRKNKIQVELDGRAIWIRAVELFATRPEVVKLILVINPEELSDFKQKYAANLMFMNVQVVAGGAERVDSVEAGLKAVPNDVDYVAIHDAARPLTPSDVIDRVFKAAQTHGAAIPGLAVTDTLKRVDPQSHVQETISRAGLWQAQTPQVFRRDLLVDVFARRSEWSTQPTDDAQACEMLGHKVVMVAGSAYNLKITTPADLDLAKVILQQREKEAKAPKARHPFADDMFG